MPINSTQGVASEAQIFLAFHALKVRKRLSPFDDLLKNGTSCRLASRAGLTLADGPAEPQWTNGLVGISSREPFDARGAHHHVLDSGTTREFVKQRADMSRPADY